MAQNVASVAAAAVVAADSAVAAVVAASVAAVDAAAVDAAVVGFVAIVVVPWSRIDDMMINNKDIILFLSINYKRIINTFLITQSLVIHC